MGYGIRGKMMLGLALVVLALCPLLAVLVSGLNSYACAVEDLDYSVNHAPRRSDLAEAIGRLFEPLLATEPLTPRAAAHQRKVFDSRLREAHEAIEDFRRKLAALPKPETIDTLAVTDTVLGQVDYRLSRLSAMRQAFDRPEYRLAAVADAIREIAHLESVVQRVPDARSGLTSRLDDALAGYRTGFVAVCITAGLVVVSLALFVWLAYRSIFVPIRALHEGARRVAQGDFDYRVPVVGRDEMTELAEAFNDMTARFREFRDEMDEQVRERTRQLVRSERLADVGFLAAGVAHEINNPLSAISMASESITMRLPDLLADPRCEDADEVREYLGMMQQESERCQGITTRLLDFARGNGDSGGEGEVAEWDLVAIVEDVVAMVRPMGKYRGRTIDIRSPDCCRAEVNGSEIKQVVLNLVANALESMEPGGKLRITLEERPDRVALVFRDDGCGMTPDVAERLFEPFFTRRRSGNGTGLGLSITHRIVDEHGGTIEAGSEGVGLGSTFRVVLPRRPAESRAA